jgi:YHS domain-containing protein
MMKKMIVSVAAIFFVATFTHAQKSPVFVNNDIAVNGYDVVSYFTEGKPVKGKKTFLYQWHDAYWLFSTKENLDSFSRNPEKYAPQFGGYCAYGISEGHKAPTEPDAWTIADGKLYLNYNTDVRELWKKDMNARIIKANENWEGLKDKE